MDRKSFGLLVSTLRKEIRNEYDEVITQADLAELAQISVVTIQKIEQGRNVVLDPDLVMSLAKALNLPARARQIFLMASTGVDDNQFIKNPIPPEEMLAQLSETLVSVQCPAIITNACGEIIYSNQSFFEIFDFRPQDLNSSTGIGQYNFFRMLCDPKFDRQRNMMGADAQIYLKQMILILKMTSLRYRHLHYFAELLPELNRFPMFRKQWQSPFYDDDEMINIIMPLSLNHPQYGNLKFVVLPQVTLSSVGDLYLYCYVPSNLFTASALVNIIQEASPGITSLAQWPAKEPYKVHTNLKTSKSTL